MPPKKAVYTNKKTGEKVAARTPLPPRSVVKMSAEELTAKLNQQREEVAALKAYYSDLFPPEFMVSDSQFRVWIIQYGFAVAIFAFERTLEELNKVTQAVEEGEAVEGGTWTGLRLVKFASRIMSDEKRKEA